MVPWLGLAAAAVIGLLGVTGLPGVSPAEDFLAQAQGGWPAMKPNTAVGLIALSLAGLALWSGRAKRVRGAIAGLALLVLALGALTLLQYLLGRNWGIDTVLAPGVMRNSDAAALYRMSPSGALCFVMSGLALLAGIVPGPQRLLISVQQALGASVLVVASVSLFAFAIDFWVFPRNWDAPGMAVFTALAFAVFGVVTMVHGARDPRHGWRLPPVTTVGFLLGITTILLAAGAAYAAIQHLRGTAEWLAHRQEVLKEIQIVEGEMATRLGWAQRGLFTGEDTAAAAIGRSRLAEHRALESLRRLTADNPSQQRRLDILQGRVARLADWERSLPAAGSEIATPERQGLSAAGAALWADARDLLEEMKAEEYTLLKKDEQQADAAARSAYAILPLGFFVGVAIVLVSVAFLNHALGELLDTQRDLGASRSRLAGIVESAMDAIVTVDEAQRIRLFNRAAERMFGAKADEMMGQPLERLIPERFRHRHAGHVQRFGETGTTSRSMGALGAISGRRMNGEEFPVEASISQIEVSGEKLFTVILRDVTERLRTEAEIRELNASLEARVARRTHELEVANRELDSFSYSVSHDLRAPLRAIGGFTALLSEEAGDRLDETSRGYLVRVLAGVERMGQLIDDLLKLSRISRNELRPQPMDLAVVAHEIVTGLRVAEPARRVDFRIAPSLPAVADPRLVRVLLENLLSNAWKFTARREDAQIEFDLAPEMEPSCFRLRDNGVGFDMRYSDKLFAPFQRLHGMREFSGTGIGLATAQRVVHRHGGAIWAESAPEAGATFFFTLGACPRGGAGGPSSS